MNMQNCSVAEQHETITAIVWSEEQTTCQNTV